MPFEQRHSEENGTAGSKDTDVSWHMGTITDLRQAWISNNSNGGMRFGFPALRKQWADGQRSVRLPDEWEWQWAAQSADKEFVYPWGKEWLNGICNTNEAGIGRTTAVGMYPAGCSTQSVHDLAGNVWEWCRNEYGSPNRVQPGGSESRVVRGGFWIFNRVNARADFRYGYHPFNRNDDIGFRVLCESPIP